VKKLAVIIAVAVCLVLSWYLFVRDFEFEVNFKAKTSAGDIIQSLRIWNKTQHESRIIKVDSLERLVQEVQWKGRSYVYTWNFETLNDSTTEVNVLVSEPGKEKINKLLIPVTKQPIEEDAAEMVQTFYEVLQEHLRITRVEIVGEAETSPSFCVCRSLSTLQTEKAYGMMKDYDILTSFVSSFNLKASGPPSVRVNKWSHTSNELNFDFCFSIIKPEVLPQVSQSITFKEFKSEKALKATFYGNYITSDRAWYELIKLAQKGGYKITGLPIEYFHDNPSLGLNEKEWRAEVYLPVE
jgi:hypothetical protein